MENRCNVQCYGRGEIHEKIAKELDISQCEAPGVPCVLFVYKVSHEIQDIRNALHWVTGGGTVRKEDICAVILLQKSRAAGEEKITTDPELFQKGTKVFRVFWMESSSWWSRSKTYQCPTVIQTVKQSLINRTRSRGGSCSGWSVDPQGGETLSVPNERSDSRISSSWSLETNGSSSEKLNCNVQCYGRGDVHEEIVKELNTNQCEGPRIPCVLFVYNVSCEIEDFRNALQWVTGDGRVRKEDICAVILLQKSRDVGEGQIRTYLGLFHEGTAVHRVLWRETYDILKRRSADCQCPNTIRGIRQSLSDRTRSREHPSPGQGDNPPVDDTPVMNEQLDCSISSGFSQMKRSRSSENLQCNVQCYGPGNVDEKIMKKLKISQCEEPGVPCVLFVYKVSHENQDLRAALQRVTGDGTVRKEDICSVILLQKPGDFRVNKMTTDPGLFHEGTNVFQIFWTEASVTWTSSDEGHAVIQTVRQSLVNKTKSRGVSCPGLNKDPQGSETPSSYSVPTSMCCEQPDHSTPSTGTQEKSEKSSEKLQCNVQCYGRGDVHEKIVKKLKISQCEGPGVPCVLFVYKVSHENQDLGATLQWVTGDGTVQKEDICSVILLQKSRDFRVNKMTTDPGLFHEGANVFQIFWTEASVTWTSTDECHAVIQTIRQSLVNKTKSRGMSCPGV